MEGYRVTATGSGLVRSWRKLRDGPRCGRLLLARWQPTLFAQGMCECSALMSPHFYFDRTRAPNELGTHHVRGRDPKMVR
jgi:hypothetical protein